MMRTGELSGGVSIDVDLARKAVGSLADLVGLADAESVAQGVLRIAASRMAGAIRGITVDRGVDPRGATIAAYGGAGPLFGCLLADELDIDRVLVPANGGNFSAVGLLTSDLTRTASRTLVGRLDQSQLDRALVSARDLVAGLAPNELAEREVSLDLRYAGQEHTLTRVLPVGASLEDVRSDFFDAYRRVFGHSLDGAVEMAAVRVTTRLVLSDDDHSMLDERSVSGSEGPWPMWSFHRSAWLDATVVGRHELPRGTGGAPTPGPLLIVEATTTTYVDAGWTAAVDELGCLSLVRTTRSDAARDEECA
jgi:N-methylhydantoinase A